MMRLITQADRLRRVNKALGTHYDSLDSLPIDYVEAIVAWAGELEAKGLL